MLIRGPHAEFIKQDLEDLYLRERARGMSFWRARWRYARRVCDSSFHIWRGDRPPTKFRGGSMLQDLRFALRLFRKHPVPVGIAIGGLALAIGVVSSVFTIVDATMLKPYGMDEPSSVVSVGSASFHGFSDWSYSTFLRMQAEATLSHIEASRLNALRFSSAPGADDNFSRQALFVSGGYLQMLGGRPVLGRALEPSDDAPGAPLVAVVSHQFWSSALSRDPDVAGKTIRLNDVAVSVVGVLRPEFNGPVDLRPAMWVPLAAFDDLIGGAPLDPTARGSVTVIGRLATGATRRSAQDNLSAIVNRVNAGASPAANDPRPAVILFSAASPIDGRDAAESYLGIGCIFAIVGLVLAVACANTANLLLAAATTRIKEMGVRLALGASTRRLIRQMVNESVLLALIAGGLGFLFAIWFAPILGTLLNLSPGFSAAPDMRLLVFTIVVALVCGLGAGLSPARHGARGNVLAALKSHHGAQPIPGRSRLRTSFVGFQAAVSIFLLVAAALFARTATVMSRTEAGFDADRMLTVSTGGSRTGFNAAAYFQAAVAALRDVPSVERVSVTQHLPWGWSLHRMEFTHGFKSYQVNINVSDEQFFQSAGVRIMRGRAFTREEVEQEAHVALISESVAHAFFRESDPVGRPLSTVPAMDFQLNPATVIGVVGDAQLTPMEAQIYGSVYRPIPHLSAGDPEKSENLPGLVIRTGNPARTARAVENALRRIDLRVRPETSVVSERMATYLDNKKMFAWLSAPMALLVVLLAVLGVMGVTAFAVTQRMYEVSVRLAMGASSGDIRWLLLRDNLRPVVIGLAVGLFLILIGARLTSRMFDLSGISPHDPIAVGGATCVLILGALTAVILPARHAAKADPARLLRNN